MYLQAGDHLGDMTHLIHQHIAVIRVLEKSDKQEQPGFEHPTHFKPRKEVRKNGWGSPAHRSYDSIACRWKQPRAAKEIMPPPRPRRPRQCFCYSDTGASWFTSAVLERPRKDSTSDIAVNCWPCRLSWKQESYSVMDRKHELSNGQNCAPHRNNSGDTAKNPENALTRLERLALAFPFEWNARKPRTEEQSTVE